MDSQPAPPFDDDDDEDKVVDILAATYGSGLKTFLFSIDLL